MVLVCGWWERLVEWWRRRKKKRKERTKDPKLKKESMKQLEMGTVVQDWTVIKYIDSGGFGHVYKVKKGKNIKALKLGKEEDRGFVIETSLLKLMTRENLSQTPKLADEGTYKNKPFIVMELMGKGVFERTEDSTFSEEGTKKKSITGLRVGIQALKGIFDMHSAGILHRDLKRENMITDSLNQDSVCLLDFNLSRIFTRSNGRLKIPRGKTGVKGTSLFMSYTTEAGRDTGRADDLWSWFYVICEIKNGSLPWDNNIPKPYKKSTSRPNSVVCYLDWKVPLFPARHLIGQGPDELYAIRFHLECLNFESCPDYMWIFSQIDKALNGIGADPGETLYPRQQPLDTPSLTD